MNGPTDREGVSPDDRSFGRSRPDLRVAPVADVVSSTALPSVEQ